MLFLFNSVYIVLCERYRLKMVICHDKTMISREARVRVRVRVSVLPLIAMSVYCVLCERYDNRFAPQTWVRFSARVSVMTAYFFSNPSLWYFGQ